ncbi:hypothetical protein FRX31_026637 [Thalictrum thalictroides]|uniref:Transmembrane protein n=1 Tax=Thalictrum thalictroides TaxID=46969 RepID=A0A7J6VHL1_THATH|nr:hypothetical protein FRX31_026637 [Thalictrum thalictroides]
MATTHLFLASTSLLFNLTVLLVVLMNILGQTQSIRIGSSMKPIPEEDLLLAEKKNHGKVIDILSKGYVPPSGPSHRGHKASKITRHLLSSGPDHLHQNSWKLESMQFIASHWPESNH